MATTNGNLKVAIVGAGHNGLTCACYLAGAGLDVTVYERREIAGGLCVTEEIFGGFKVSPVASYFGMLRQEVIDDLDLTGHGLETYLTDPIEIVMLDDGKYVFVPRDGTESKMQVGSLTASDLDGWQRFWADIGQAAEIVYPYYLQAGVAKADICRDLTAAGLGRLSKFVFDGSLVDLMHEYLKNRDLMAIAATCTPGFANKKGSVFGCIHHGTARTNGEKGAWGQVRGGMGAITRALAEVASERGVEIIVGAPVKSIAVQRGVAVGVVLENGEEQAYDLVISNADPYTTFNRLLPDSVVPADLKTHLEAVRPTVSAAKVHFALSSLPPFPLLDEIGHNYKGVIVIAPPLPAVIADSEAVPSGRMPERLMLTMAFPSVSDDSIAPEGKHLLTVDIHYLPALIDGQRWDEAAARELIEATVAAIEKHSPEFRKFVDDSAVVSPGDLVTTYGVASASCWHMPMADGYLFEDRNLPGCAAYATPIENLYLCGAGAYPGGNVTGAPGHNCAHAVLSHLPTRI